MYVRNDGSVGKYHIEYISSNVGRSGDKLLQVELKKKVTKVRVEPDIVPQLMLGRLKSPSRIRSSLRLFVLMRLCSKEKYDWSALGGIYKRITVRVLLCVDIEMTNFLASFGKRIRLEEI